MKENLYQKRRTKRYVRLILTCFESSVEKDNVKEEKKVDRLIEIQLNKHGWYKQKW